VRVFGGLPSGKAVKEHTGGCGSRVGSREPEPGDGCTNGMGRQLAVIAFVVALIGAPAPAAAKEISRVSVCGKHRECTVYDKADFNSLMFLAQDAGPTDPPAAAAPWYRVRFTVDAREHGGGLERWTVAYVPPADVFRVREQGGGFTWVALNPRTARVLERAVVGLPAFPKARLRGLHVEPPEARVDEVFSPAADTAARRDRDDAATTAWGWVAGGALAAALLILGGRMRSARRAREPSGGMPSPGRRRARCLP
jgi:hypothetical protein